MTLIFGIGVDFDLGYVGIAGQRRRSKVKVKCLKSSFDITVSCLLPCIEFKVKGRDQGQRSGSRSNVLCVAVDN